MAYLEVNGTTLYYEDRGTGKEVIVFSHGLLWSAKMFAKQVAHFEQKYRVIAYDHRNQGRSAKSNASFDMETNYKDALALIKALDLPPVHFVGLSMGGFVGMRLAARNQKLIKSLILMETSADEEPNTFKYTLLNTIVKLAGVKSVSSKVMPIMFGKDFLKDPHREEERAHWRKELEANEKSITKAVEAVIKRKSVYHEIPAIKCPTLIIVGDQDVATVPDKAIRIHNQIMGSSLKFIEGAGHSSCIEEPLHINAAMDEFFSQQFPKTMP
jgi:pimeloyl-ACP methyl ester carboxylesterase